MKKTTHKSREDVRGLPLKVKAEMALKEAVAEALAEHKRRGNPIAVWRMERAMGSQNPLDTRSSFFVYCCHQKAMP